ncbi:hypothetical protein [Paractinoplanes rishiriensis]|nr:hypothetical protein [Actinoplanes rishiriensis]
MTKRQRIATLLLTAGLFLGACGSDSDDSGGIATLGDQSSPAASKPAASKPAGDVEKEVMAYVECLRKQGVDMPDPTFDENGQLVFARPAGGQQIDRDKLRAAQEKCGEPPEGITSAAQSMINSPEFQDAALKFAKCMREQGVDLPDPDFSNLGSGMFGRLDRDDPKVAAAMEECQDVWAGIR